MDECVFDKGNHELRGQIWDNFLTILFKSALLVFYQNFQHNLQKNKGSKIKDYYYYYLAKDTKPPDKVNIEITIGIEFKL